MKSVHAYSFETTGMAIIPKALSLEKVAEAKQLIQNNWPSGAPWKFPVLHLGRVFWEMMTQPVMLELCQQFAGDHFRMDHAFGLTSNGAHAQLHGGPQSSQYSCFYLPLSGEKHPGIAGQLNFGFCLEGQSPQTGGFCYVPGSHKSVDPRAGQEILTEVYRNNFNHHSIGVPHLEPGDMILFTEALIHGDTGWRNRVPGSCRMQVYFKMTPGFMCWRDPAENDHLLQYAETDLERRLMAAPWTGRYSETQTSMGVTNTRRGPTV